MPQFEIYWKRLDPNNTGRVAPMDAAKFLKSSGLSDHTLGKVRVPPPLFTRHLSLGVRSPAISSSSNFSVRIGCQ